MRHVNKSMQKAKDKVRELTTVEPTSYVNRLYQVVECPVDSRTFKHKNKFKSWEPGWHPEWDFVNISKDGTIGDFIQVQGLTIAIPQVPEDVFKRSEEAEEQYWEVVPSPDDKLIKKIKSVKQLENFDPVKKNEWYEFINQEWSRREDGFWFMCNGKPTYLTGSHYFYLRWAKIDIGLPDYRDANRIFFYFWEACKVDKRSYGMCYLKNRRSGFSFMSSSETVNLATKTPDSNYGILSKTGEDAKKMFTGKVVGIYANLPFFFKPIQDGMDRPKTELAFAIPASKMTKNRMNNLSFDENEEADEGLNSYITWKSTGDNSYDGEKLKLLVHDESGKWERPNNVENNWSVTKTCLRLGSKIVGKCMMGSTCNKQKSGGAEFKSMYYDGDLRSIKRNKNFQTASGLYSLFVPMEWGYEGYIDKFGYPVFETPQEPVLGIDGEMIDTGVIDYWENEFNGLKHKPAKQNEYVRQYPRTENHAFRDEINGALFNIAKINAQIEHNVLLNIPKQQVQTGVFQWRNGVEGSEVVWVPRREDESRFKISWMPPPAMQNRKITRGGKLLPGNEGIGAFGCDPYDIDGVNYGSGSNGALHGITTANTADWAPSMTFFLEYVCRPQTSYVFFEDVMKACIFYGMPILIENNKPGILRHFKNKGYHEYCMLRPDKRKHELRPSDISLRGIPNNSEDVKQMHAGMIEAYVEEYIGEDEDGNMGTMPFNDTLEDWLKFELQNRTDYDASISSGLAIMAVRKQQILVPMERKNTTLRVPFGRYDNSGLSSRLIE